MSEQKVFQRHGQHVRFQNDDLDFYLLWFMGYSRYGGAAIGECLYIASQINEKDPDSWVRAWNHMAARLDAQAAEALQAGHPASARMLYLRATTYYRAAAMLLPPDDRYRQSWQNVQRCFRAAASLTQPPVEPVAIPYEGQTLNAYLVRVADDLNPRPTLIMVGGGETFAEELYFWAGVPGQRRGYNVLLVDLPLQGASPFLGIPPRAEMELPLGAVVDYLLTRPEVDADRICIYGVSGGGYMVTRAAAYEKRFRAVAASTPINNLYAVIESEWPPVLRAVPGFVSGALLKLATQVDPISRIVMQKFLWAAGVNSVPEYMAETKAAVVDVRQIECPMLCLAAAKDPQECLRQTEEVYQLLPNPKKAKHIFTPETGADAHCHVNNPELAYQVLFDWLDDVLEYRPEPALHTSF